MVDVTWCMKGAGQVKASTMFFRHHTPDQVRLYSNNDIKHEVHSLKESNSFLKKKHSGSVDRQRKKLTDSSEISSRKMNNKTRGP